MIYFVIDAAPFWDAGADKRDVGCWEMFNAVEGGVWRHDVIGAAEYWRRWLLGKYSTPSKVAFGATKYMGAAEKCDGYCKKYSTLPKTVLIYSWRRRRPAGAVLKNSSI